MDTPVRNKPISGHFCLFHTIYQHNTKKLYSYVEDSKIDFKNENAARCNQLVSP